jgi:hypothetical protein
LGNWEKKGKPFTETSTCKDNGEIYGGYNILGKGAEISQKY